MWLQQRKKTVAQKKKHDTKIEKESNCNTHLKTTIKKNSNKKMKSIRLHLKKTISYKNLRKNTLK